MPKSKLSFSSLRHHQQVKVNVVAVIAGLVVAGCSNPQRAAMEAAAAALPADEAAAVKAGVPLDLSKLERVVPASKNAAVIYRKAFRTLPWREEARVGFSQVIKEPLSPNSIQAANHFFETNSAIMADLEAAAQLKDCDFGLDYGNASALSPELGRLKSLADIFVYRARVRAHEGQYKPAVSDLVTAVRIGDHAAQEGLFLSYFICGSVRILAYKAVDQIASDQAGTPTAVTAMREAVQQFGPIPDVKRAFQIEGAKVRQGLHAKPRSHAAEGKQDKWPGGVDGTTALNAYAARVLELTVIELNILKSDASIPEKLGKFRVAVEPKKGDPASDLYGEGNGGPNFNNEVGMYFADDVRKQVALSALKVLVIKARTGQLPDSLPAGTPADVFSNGALQYQKTGVGFLLYSVGPNGKDESGTGDDIVFSYPYSYSTPTTP